MRNLTIQYAVLVLMLFIAADVRSDESVQAGKDNYVLKDSVDFPTLKVVTDLKLDLIGKEPRIANPLYLNFDERGRMWLVQYRQYPWPAGLKLLSRDRVWRNIYEPPFAPPPPHEPGSLFRGKDRITIHEDKDGDGTFESETTFLDGLNFATAALKGRGGVFVMNPPYLLFYEDKNCDDVPDSKEPRILLSGFGIEDSHSIANSLRWGPDGWIYATQGSTISAAIVRHGDDGRPIPGEKPVFTMGQNVWRYHPERHVYEVFGEGGGNSFGIEFDSKGRVFSGHNGGDTRGFHYVQGGYWRKNFGKHGNLSNPYAFDYFEAMQHHSVKRFTHTFSIYDSTVLPERYHGKLFGVNPVGHNVVHSEISANGASRKTVDLSHVVEAGQGDRANWFTPVDIQTGPDGALYVADWYSVQPNHYKNHEGQTNPDLGRVYRIRPHQFQPIKPFDLSKLSSLELVRKYLNHTDRWYRHTALRLLADRKDQTVCDELRMRLFDAKSTHTLEAFWALNVCGAFDESLAAKTLNHSNPFVRLWTVRLLGDAKQRIRDSLAHKLNLMAAKESHVEVVCQLASTAMRLPSEQALPIIASLAKRDEFSNDIYVPKMVWWALESKANDASAVEIFKDAEIWNSKMLAGKAALHENMMRRYIMKGNQSNYLLAARLCELATDQEKLSELVRGFARALEGQPMPAIPARLSTAIAQAGGDYALLLAVRNRTETAIQKAIATIADSKKKQVVRQQLIQALADINADAAATVPALLKIVEHDASVELKNVALASLQKFDDEQVGTAVLTLYAKLPSQSTAAAQTLLASRFDWAKQFLNAIQQGAIAASKVESDVVDRLRHHRDEDFQALVSKLFPSTELDAKQLDKNIERIATTVREKRGNPAKGRDLFHGKASCGKCHELFGRGQYVGPNLTSYNRNDIGRMLFSIVNPSAEIREGFENFSVITDDGRVVSGLKIEENDKLLVLRGADGQNQTLQKDEIEESFQDKRSIMPQGLLESLTESELRDLFAFLVSTTPPL